ncbi:MAG: N-acetylmuramoyl-L-alanine amidase, partial [Lachnospiraceae bacterium]|nr:N-acetylmuramoyl-L-alanine amidase [Lachnospiraceae bacterium]
MEKIKKVTVHAGHNPAGKTAHGAVEILDESKAARTITKKVIALLQGNGIKAVNCTVNNGVSQNDVLKKICAKCNAQANVDLNISIHFNSGAGDSKGNGKTTGTEVFVRPASGDDAKLTKTLKTDKGDVARRVCNQMEKLGFKNRGVKSSTSLYVLNHTKAPAILIEVCFADDKDDAKLYRKDKDAVAKASLKAVLNH